MQYSLSLKPILSLTLFIAALLLGPACTTTSESRDAPAEQAKPSEEVDDLRARIEDILEGASRPGEEPPGTVREQVERIAREIRERLEDEYSEKLNLMFGAPEPLQEETVELEAVDADGNVVDVPFETQTRELRRLTDPRVAPKAQRLLVEDDVALDLYRGVPRPIQPERREPFRRIYRGEDAEAIAMEAKLIVSLKGGDWVTAAGRTPAANAVAVRGLDLSRGLVENSNQTYDDSVYVVIEPENGPAEVYEYRMTTESSNPKRGVGRLDSKQVIYHRGLHKGKDPAFRLVGNVAEGTRRGLEGKYEITGANIHSAYTRRQIDSTTPLSPNVSLGCQVIAASKQEFERTFVGLLDAKGIRRFPYTIVGNDEVAELDRILREEQIESVLVRSLPRS